MCGCVAHGYVFHVDKIIENQQKKSSPTALEMVYVFMCGCAHLNVIREHDKF